MSTDKAPADSLMRMAYTQDLTQLIQERDRWKARAEQLEAAAQQERARRDFVRYEMIRIADREGTKPARFRIYGYRENGLMVEIDTLYLRDVPEVASHPPPTPEDR